MKTFNVTAGDTITATYTAGTGFVGSSGTTTQTVTPRAITVTAATSTKVYDGTTSSTATPTITPAPGRSHHPGWLRWANRFQRWHRQRGKI